MRCALLAALLLIAGSTVPVLAQANPGPLSPADQAALRQTLRQNFGRGSQQGGTQGRQTLQQQQAAAKAAATQAAAKEEAAKQDLLKAANIRRDEQKKQAEQAREAHQPKRVEETIAKGALSADELAAVDARDAALKKVEEQFKTNGFLTKDEAKKLHAIINETSQQIWGDASEGTDVPLHKLGANVAVSPDLNARIDSGCMTRAEARTILKDFRRMMSLRKTLSTQDLAADRAKVQEEYNVLLNQYFTMKAATTQAAAAAK